MKKVVVFIFLSVYGIAQAQPELVTNHIKCAPGIDVKDEGKFGIKLKTRRGQSLKALTEVNLFLDSYLNGVPVSMSGSIQFTTSQNVSDVHNRFAQTVTAHRADPTKNPAGTFKNGVLSCKFSTGGGEAPIVANTQKLGKLYQCPLAQDIKVIGQQKTDLVFLKPQSKKKESGESMWNWGVPQIMTSEVADKVLIPAPNRSADGKQLYYYNTQVAPTAEQKKEIPTTELAKLFPVRYMYDPTAGSKKVPMLFEKHELYTYQFSGRYGADVVLESPSIHKEHAVKDGQRVTTAIKAGNINVGVSTDGKNRALNQYGEILVPNCRSTNFKRVGTKTMVQCVYGNNIAEDKNIVLEADITHDIDLASASMWGASVQDRGAYPLQRMTQDYSTPLAQLTDKLKDGDSAQFSSLLSPDAQLNRHSFIGITQDGFMPPPFMIVTKH